MSLGQASLVVALDHALALHVAAVAIVVARVVGGRGRFSSRRRCRRGSVNSCTTRRVGHNVGDGRTGEVCVHEARIVDLETGDNELTAIGHVRK